jgi:hypothetical protein
MARSPHRRKFGIVILLDALGAATYSDKQIKAFLAARSEVNSFVKQFATRFKWSKRGAPSPAIHTFGDTLIITIAVANKSEVGADVARAVMVMRRYMYHSMLKGVFFRGAFSIGDYIEDDVTNTVMGNAVSDAAAWYDKADWFGICATPRTTTAIDFYRSKLRELSAPFAIRYPVPLKGGGRQDLLCISWPGAFFDEHLLKESGFDDAKRHFYSLLKDVYYPIVATSKYENAKAFFLTVSQAIAAQKAGKAKAPAEP